MSYDFYRQVSSADDISLTKLIDLASGKNVDVNAEGSSGDGNLLFLKTTNPLRIKALIRIGCDVNFKNTREKATPIFFQEDPDVIKELINAGAKVNHLNYAKQNALFFATNVESLKLLHEAGAKINQIDKWGKNITFYLKDPEMLKYAISQGLNINLVDKNGRNALFDSNLIKNVNMVKELISKNIDIEYCKDTILLEAVIYDSPKQVLSMLIKHGANIYGEDEYGNTMFSHISKLEKLHAVFMSNPQPVDLGYKLKSGKTILEQLRYDFHVIDLFESDMFTNEMLLSPYKDGKLIEKISQIYSSRYGHKNHKIEVIEQKLLLNDLIHAPDNTNKTTQRL